MNYSPVERRLLAEHGDGLGAFLRELYVERGHTYRELKPLLGTCSIKRIRALLEKYGVPIRRGAEAVAHQWARNPERRETQSKRGRETMLERAAHGIHWAKGHTKESHEGLARVSQKVKQSGRLATETAQRKGAAARRRRHRDDPSLHLNASAKPTRIERAVMAWLERKRLAFVFQHPIRAGDDLFFADFYLPDVGILIEVSKLFDRVPVERLRAFRAAGYATLAVMNGVVDAGRWDDLDEVIARAQRGEFNPATVGECWVAGRANNLTAARKRYLAQRLG